MPHVARAAVASKNCLQPPAMSKSQAQNAIYLQRLSMALHIIQSHPKARLCHILIYGMGLTPWEWLFGVVCGSSSCYFYFFYRLRSMQPISDFPDHATYRDRGANTGLVRETWEFPDPLFNNNHSNWYGNESILLLRSCLICT